MLGIRTSVREVVAASIDGVAADRRWPATPVSRAGSAGSGRSGPPEPLIPISVAG